MQTPPPIPHFLCDTWWYGLTSRFDDDTFSGLADQRSREGFSAIQLVAGIPPEVGPGHPSAISPAGPAWTQSGSMNRDYLAWCRQRILELNHKGFKVIVYGAWGQHVDWLGVEGMTAWWRTLIAAFDDLDVLYCLTGESNLWAGKPRRLLPDRCTSDLLSVRLMPYLPKPLLHTARQAMRLCTATLHARHQRARKQKWSTVLDAVHGFTKKPWLIHTLIHETSEDVVRGPDRFSAITVQTGHLAASRPLLWQLPRAFSRQQPDRPFINLEPWYEGILGQFGATDQIFAYWASILAGAHAYCYGAHGIWNAGDGKFLNHWGGQTLAEARLLDTPRFIGISHALANQWGIFSWNPCDVTVHKDRLVSISKSDGNGRSITFWPDASAFAGDDQHEYFCPLSGRFVNEPPAEGPLVAIRA